MTKLRKLRKPIPRDALITVGAGAVVYPTCRIVGSRVSLGASSFLGDFCFISVRSLSLLEGAQVNSGSRLTGRAEILIGEDAVIGYGCTLLTSTDKPRAYYMNDARPETVRAVQTGDIEIGDRAFIGSHTVVMPSVEIAEGVVVQALSYVNHDLAKPDTIYGGRPARPIKPRVYPTYR